eukprot:sb/3469390/
MEGISEVESCDLEPLEFDHMNDFNITTSSMRNLSTQTVGLDDGFFDDKPCRIPQKRTIDVPKISATVRYRHFTAPSFPKPVYSYSCLITLALKHSPEKKLTVSEIYRYIQAEFPYFRSAHEGWKNSVRHNLSLNKAFCKVDRHYCAETGVESGVSNRKGSYWCLNQNRESLMDREILKWKLKHGESVRASMICPDKFWDPPNDGLLVIRKECLTSPGQKNLNSAITEDLSE